MTHTCRRLFCLSLALFLIPLTASARNGAQAAQFSFDRDAGAGWRVQEGRWLVESGRLIHLDPFAKSALLARPGEAYANLDLSLDIDVPATTDTAGIEPWGGVIIGARNPLAEGPWSSGHMIFLRPGGGVQLYDFENSGAQAAPTPPGVRRLEVETHGHHLRVCVDGRLVIEHEAAAPIRGEIALASQAGRVAFDNLRLSGERITLVPVPRVAFEPPRIEPGPRMRPLPRIAIRMGPGGVAEFYERESGRRYFPEGWNHTVIGAGGWHSTFNVDVYDASQMERDLAEMAALGANVVRVWAWGEQLNGSGHVGARAGRSLNAAYLANFIDFLRRATRHRIHVIAVLDELGFNAYDRGLLEHTPSNDPRLLITGANRRFFTREWIEVKRQQAEHFVGALAAAQPDLLPTILCWQLQNEIAVNHSEGPFNRFSGQVMLPTGVRYSMANPAERQAFYDHGIAHWASELTRGIKRADPQALTSAGMWTADIHLRPPTNGLLPDGKDPRIPPRPSALAGRDCALDFLDLHIYAMGGVHLDPWSMELHRVRSAGKPIILGEYGVFTGSTRNPARARQWAQGVRQRAYAFGFQGSMFWAWSLCEPEFKGIWCAQQADLDWELRPIGAPPAAYWGTPAHGIRWPAPALLDSRLARWLGLRYTAP